MKKGLSRAERKAEKQRIKEEEKKKNFKLGLLLMGLGLLLCIGFLILDGNKEAATSEENATEEVTGEQVAVTTDEPSADEPPTNDPVLAIGSDINTVGDRVAFGEYEGKKIEWWVCETKEGKSLIVSAGKVAEKPFNDSVQAEATSWELSSLRLFLNDSFINEAFNDECKECILESEVMCDGALTYDKVFMLNEEQYRKYSDLKSVHFDDNCWLLESIGDSNVSYCLEFLEESDIDRSGEIDYGLRVNEDCGVRPALWVDSDRFKESMDN